MTKQIFEADERWTEFLEAVRAEMRTRFKSLNRQYTARKGPHSGEAGAGATALEDQLAYRRKRHDLWKDAVREGKPETRVNLVTEQISGWGGIHGNGDKLLRSYALLSAPKLICLGAKGISSWSKGLALRNPRQFAVYDARVAMTLNAIQAIELGTIHWA